MVSRACRRVFTPLPHGGRRSQARPVPSHDPHNDGRAATAQPSPWRERQMGAPASRPVAEAKASGSTNTGALRRSATTEYGSYGTPRKNGGPW